MVNLEEEADASTEGVKVVTKEVLLEKCPKALLATFKKLKSDEAIVDFAYSMYNNELRDLRKELQEMDDFYKAIKAYFIQQYENKDGGVVGKQALMVITKKDQPSVTDWTVLYEYIRKRKAFDLLKRSLNDKSVRARWEEDKAIPGVGSIPVTSVSLTKVKK